MQAKGKQAAKAEEPKKQTEPMKEEERQREAQMGQIGIHCNAFQEIHTRRFHSLGRSFIRSDGLNRVLQTRIADT